ncbi:hypothetical protein RJ639_000851 [Escallonia herrerae]|uniref:CCHC-type domain-containing protein n=1 Tax=Escallonia herrerae TaxID=1293975 RepID=A0AA89BG66_9ASTE|nr:hypothetical protein RJ639_000851 [Escallonia herrerae]
MKLQHQRVTREWWQREVAATMGGEILVAAMTRGKGCFNCGSLDHIAKECTGSPTANHQAGKFILKDGNAQRGGDGSSRYEMVFDGETSESPHRHKRRRDHEIRDPTEKQNSDEYRQSNYRKKESRDARRLDDRRRGHGKDERYGGGRTSPSSRRERDHKERDEWDHKRSGDGGNRRDMGEMTEYTKRSTDYNSRHTESEREQTKRRADYDDEDDQRADGSRRKKRDDDHRRDNADKNGRTSLVEERDYGKRSKNERAYDKRSDERDYDRNRRRGVEKRK